MADIARIFFYLDRELRNACRRIKSTTIYYLLSICIRLRPVGTLGILGLSCQSNVRSFFCHRLTLRMLKYIHSFMDLDNERCAIGLGKTRILRRVIEVIGPDDSNHERVTCSQTVRLQILDIKRQFLRVCIQDIVGQKILLDTNRFSTGRDRHTADADAGRYAYTLAALCTCTHEANKSSVFLIERDLRSRPVGRCIRRHKKI